MKEKMAVILAGFCVLAGLAAAALIWTPLLGADAGLGLTNLNNSFVFGLWIIADLSLIAFGSAAFATALIHFIFRRRYLRGLVPLSVAVGLLCYGCAGFILLLEIGQPLRFWFPFRHPNFVSMLTEITFCITLYSLVLILEFTPVALGHRRLRRSALACSVKQRLLLALPVLAAIGVFLSLLHQGSLGGVYGVLFARPFAWRPGLGIWPWTCLLFIVSAMAAGPLFMALIAGIVARAGKVHILSGLILDDLGRFAAWLLGLNLALRGLDLLLWRFWLLPEQGISFDQMFHGLAFGKWLLAAELALGSLFPLLILTRLKWRTKPPWFFAAAALACLGLVLNRYIMNLQTLAVPTLPFDNWKSYHPNLVEIAPVLMALGLFVLVLRFLFKQGLLFERDK